jgi:methyl-accepting chemotaxis protein
VAKMNLSDFSIKKRLWTPIIVLTLVIVVTVVGYLNLKSNIEASEASLSRLQNYSLLANSAQLTLLKFASGEVSIDELETSLSAIRTVPASISDKINASVFDGISQRAKSIDQGMKKSSGIQFRVMSLTAQSIGESNSYMPYVVGNLLENSNSVSELEINTIVGASNNTNANYTIQTLFLQMVANPDVYDELMGFIDRSIENATKDAQALKGTQFEESPKKALAINKEVQTLVNQYRTVQSSVLRERDATLNEFDQILQTVGSSVLATNESTFASINGLISTLIVLLIVSISIIAFLNLATAKSIIASLETVTEKARELANFEGDLTNQLPVVGKDEISEMSSQLNRFIAKVRDIVADIKQLAVDCERISEELDAMNTSVSKDINDQQLATEQVATAVNEMSSSITEISQNANNTAEAAQNAANESNEGHNLISVTRTEVGNMTTNMAESVTLMKTLNQVSEDIGSIVDVIGTIAEQTNLLALNAAIEAARAGEQGRGFSVVADEVRSLATKTQDSLGKINTMISSLRGAITSVVDNIETNQASFTNVESSTTASSDALDQIKIRVDLISDSSIQIAAAVEEQSTVTESINQSIISIKDLTDESLRKSAQTCGITNDMRNRATSLSGLVCKFKT